MRAIGTFVCCGLALTACTPAPRPDRAALSNAVAAYLADGGRLCLGKTAWPIDVTQHDIDAGARDAVQMPVLERLALVASSVADVVVDDEGTKHPMRVRRYALTDAGRAWYVARTPGMPADLCVARLTLDRVSGWASPSRSPDVVVVRYTYRVDAAPWTSDADVRRAFPVVAAVVRGAGTAELEQTLHRAGGGWTVVDGGA